MYTWLNREIMEMPGSDYLTLYIMLTVGFFALLYYAYGAFRRFRFMDATATSKIRSAAQGHVELKGLGEWLPEGEIESPFSRSRCIWYHCTIEKRKRIGKRTTWTNISDELSGHLFRLVDDTGECIIDPDDAHVIPEADETWYGHSTESRNQPPLKPGWISLGMGKYRFRERLIKPATSLYALGWFKTVYSNPSDEFISSRVEDLVRQWKLQPQKYLRDFDFDGNGRIQQGEWKAVRTKARKQVLAAIASEKNENHIMSRPGDKRHPFILSAIEEEALVAQKKLMAYASTAGAFILFSTLVIMYSVRAPIPV